MRIGTVAPLRYMHSPAELCEFGGVANAARSVAAFALELGGGRFAAPRRL